MAPAASKEIQELQRDVALLQQQVKDLQRSQDEKFAAITELCRQSIDAANHANTGVAVIQSNLDKSLREQMDKVSTPVVGLSTKLTEMGSDLRTLQQAVQDLTALMSRMQTQLTDISNGIKVNQSPLPTPPPNAIGNAAAATDAPPMPATKLYETARGDYLTGKYDLASPEFTDYLKYYGNTELAPNAQFYIAMIHYAQKDFAEAVKQFDLVLDKYPDNNKTADALLYKGRSLVKMPGHRNEGANEFMEVIKRYPKTDQANLACDERKAIGMGCGAPPASRTGAKKKK
jgi:tol-pal system protein YbgF